jgi:hypothetical protein
VQVRIMIPAGNELLENNADALQALFSSAWMRSKSSLRSWPAIKNGLSLSVNRYIGTLPPMPSVFPDTVRRDLVASARWS